MMDSIHTTFTVKDNIATVVVTTKRQLSNSANSISIEEHLVEVPEGVEPTRKYILGKLHANN